MINPGESALAILGISNVIKGEKEVPRWTKQRQSEAAKMPKTIADLAREVCTTSIKLKPIKRDHDYRTTMERLRVGVPPAEIQKMVDKFPDDEHDTALAFVVTAGNAMTHLKEIFPVSELDTFTGPKNILPSNEAVAAFFLQLAVLNDPLCVFNLIGCGAMLRSQSKTVREFFPSIADEIDSAFYSTIAELGAADDKFRLPPRARVGLENWLQRRVVDHDPDPAPPINPAAMRKPGPSATAAAELSPSQRVQNGGTTK